MQAGENQEFVLGDVLLHRIRRLGLQYNADYLEDVWEHMSKVYEYNSERGSRGRAY